MTLLTSSKQLEAAKICTPLEERCKRRDRHRDRDRDRVKDPRPK